jgi:uncharacterized membrane protein
MATLTVWRYDTVDGAATAADLLKKLARKDVLILQDAAVVVWEPGEGKPRTRQLGPSTTAAGALGGGMCNRFRQMVPPCLTGNASFV